VRFEVKGLTKSFGEKRVLEGVSFSVESGAALGLLGRNGAGKTTAIRMIMGVLTGGGEILLDGKPMDRRAVNIGYLPEERGLYPKKKILDQLTYFGSLRGMRPRDARRSAMRWLERLGMEEFAGKRLDTLSKGNQQKIQLACALVTDPDFVILDEPFSGLDPVNARLLRDVVRELIDAGRLVLFSSHQMNYVEEFCEKIAILNGGTIVLEGAIRDVKRGYDRSLLDLGTREPEALSAAIRTSLRDLISDVQPAPGGLRVTLRREGDKAAFVEGLARLGVDFDSVQVHEPTLETIFVEYTAEEVAS